MARSRRRRWIWLIAIAALLLGGWFVVRALLQPERLSNFLLQQAQQATGLVVTKLDGTAKGGVIFALAREFGIPIRFVGLGESLHDLRAFDPHAFVDALLPESLSA